MSTDDLKYICTLLTEARSKSLDAGEYDSSLSIYETVLKLLNKAFLHTDPSLTDKVSRLRDICRCETKLLKDYIAERAKFSCSTSSSSNSHNNRRNKPDQENASNEENDPDVWPPPTPNPNANRPPPLRSDNRSERGKGNGNAWGVERREVVRHNNNHQQNNNNNRNNDMQNKVEQMRKDRDSHVGGGVARKK